MISQPMGNRTEEEVEKERERIIRLLESQGFEVVDNWFAGDKELDVPEGHFIPLYYLAESVKLMSTCTAVYFAKGWENARGCRVEHECAKAYELEIMYEE